jgi:hypothetical protein
MADAQTTRESAAETDAPHTEIGELREGEAGPHHHDIEGLGRDSSYKLCDIAAIPRAGGIRAICAGLGKRDQLFDRRLQRRCVEEQSFGPRDEHHVLARTVDRGPRRLQTFDRGWDIIKVGRALNAILNR